MYSIRYMYPSGAAWELDNPYTRGEADVMSAGVVQQSCCFAEYANFMLKDADA